MAALAEVSKPELMARYERVKALARSVREKGQVAARRGICVGAAAAGGFAAGVIDDRMPEVGGLPTNIIVGLGLGVLGAIDGAGDQSDAVCAFAGGILAGAAYEKGRSTSQELATRAARG